MSEDKESVARRTAATKSPTLSSVLAALAGLHGRGSIAFSMRGSTSVLTLPADTRHALALILRASGGYGEDDLRLIEEREDERAFAFHEQGEHVKTLERILGKVEAICSGVTVRTDTEMVDAISALMDEWRALSGANEEAAEPGDYER